MQEIHQQKHQGEMKGGLGVGGEVGGGQKSLGEGKLPYITFVLVHVLSLFP